MKVMACYSMKGGVGKTATAVNLAWFSAHSGLRTLLVDMDPQGASSFYFRVKSKKKAWDKRFFAAYEYLLNNIKESDYSNLDILPAHLSFRHFDINLSNMQKSKRRLTKILKGLRKQYDVVVLDCPPTISRLSENVFEASDLILVPVIPTTLSERTLDYLQSFFKEHQLASKKITPFLSMVQQQKQMHTQAAERLKKANKRLLNTAIPFSADIERMGEYRAPVGDFVKKRPVFSRYSSLWSEVSKTLEVL